MNLVVLMGNVGKDPETTESKGGMSISKFSLATSNKVKGEDKTTWHNLVAFDKTAQSIAQHVSKGTKILVQGRIDNQTYEKDGEKRSYSCVIVERWQFAQAKAAAPDPDAIPF